MDTGKNPQGASQNPNQQKPNITSQQSQDPRLPQVTPVNASVHPKTQMPDKNQPVKFPIELEKPQKPKNFFTKTKVVLALLTLFFLLFSGSSLILAYTNYQIYSPPKSIRQFLDGIIIATPLPKNARIILAAATAKVAGAKTATVETEITAEASGDFLIKSARVKIKGPIDFKKANQLKSEFDINGEITLEGITLSAGGSIKLIENNLYFKINEFPGGSFFRFENIKDQWYQVELDKKQQTDASAMEKTRKIQKVLENFLAVSHSWTTKEKTASDRIYLLKSTPPRQEITSLAFELIESLEPSGQTALEKNIAKEHLREWLKDLDKIEAVFEINKKTYRLEKWTITIDAKIENSFPAPQKGKITHPTVNLIPLKITISSKFTDYDKPIIIEVPQNAQDLKNYQDLLKKSQPNLQIPNGTTPPPEGSQLPPNEPSPNPSPIHDLLSSPSPVLGKQNNYWDLLLLELLL